MKKNILETITVTNPIKSFYCSQKFWFLNIDLENMCVQSCCAAKPYRVNEDWLEKNPGQLFNIPEFIHDRETMLQGQAVKNCQDACWEPEKKGFASRRTLMRSYEQTHVSTTASTPDTINLVVGNNCNLTCNYCCKHSSSAWANDVKKQDYVVKTNDGRYQFNNKDKILMHISQKEIEKSEKRSLMLQETKKLLEQKNSRVLISGGEPFLYNNLNTLLNDVSDAEREVVIWSGLGVSASRLKKELNKIKDKENIKITISAENTGLFYQYNRFNNTWKKFQDNINLIKEVGIKFDFHLVITNFTVHDIGNFLEWSKGYSTEWVPCNSPLYLNPYVLDTNTRQQVLDQNLPDSLRKYLNTVFEIPCAEEHRVQARDYSIEFAQRRGLDLNIFPKTFIQWLTR